MKVIEQTEGRLHLRTRHWFPFVGGFVFGFMAILFIVLDSTETSLDCVMFDFQYFFAHIYPT